MCSNAPYVLKDAQKLGVKLTRAFVRQREAAVCCQRFRRTDYPDTPVVCPPTATSGRGTRTGEAVLKTRAWQGRGEWPKGFRSFCGTDVTQLQRASRRDWASDPGRAMEPAGGPARLEPGLSVPGRAAASNPNGGLVTDPFSAEWPSSAFLMPALSNQSLAGQGRVSTRPGMLRCGAWGEPGQSGGRRG